MLRIGVAPCSPFSVTENLLTGAAGLARRKGFRLDTHLAETTDEDGFCRERFGRSPVEYMRDLGWLGPDVWLAHAVHLDDAAAALVAGSGTAVAQCPSSNARLGVGIARARDLRAAGVPVGLGVDGAASNEACLARRHAEDCRSQDVRPVHARAFGPRRPSSAPCSLTIVCEVIEGAEPHQPPGNRSRDGKAERPDSNRLNGDPKEPDPGNAGEGRPPRRLF